MEIQSEWWKPQQMIIPSTSPAIHTILHSKSPTSHPYSNKNQNRNTHNSSTISHSRHRTAYLINVGVLLVPLAQGLCCKQRKWVLPVWRNDIGTKRFHVNWPARRVWLPFLSALCIVPQAQHSTLRDQSHLFEVEPVSKWLKVQNRSGITKASNPFHSDCWGIITLVVTRFSIADSIHLVVLKRKGREWEI